MKKYIGIIALSLMFMLGCGPSKPTPENVAKKYCGMMEKLTKTSSSEERDKIMKEMDDYEKSIKAKEWYNEEFGDKVGNLIDECAEKYKDALRDL